MARTRAAVRQSVAANVRDLLLCTVTSVSGQTLTVPEIAHLSTSDLNGSEITIYSGTGIGQSRVIQTHTQGSGSGTLLPYINWTTTPDTTSLIEIHLRQYGFTAAKYNEAITQAYHALEDIYLTDVIDETLVMQAGRREYPIPSGFRYLHRVDMNWPTDVGVPGSVYDSGALNWGSQFYDADRGLASSSSQQKLSMGFRVTAGGNPNGYWMHGVALYMRKIGSPTGTMTVRIETDTGGTPTGTLYDTYATGTHAESTVSTTYGYVSFDLTAPIFCTSGTQLNIVVSTTRSTDATNYIAWGEDQSTNYSRGYECLYNGSAWSISTNNALIFAVQASQINQRFLQLHNDTANGPSWMVVRSSSVLSINRPVEGASLRLTGQGVPTAPSADTDTMTIPEAFLVPKATALLLAMGGAGPQTDSEARDRWSVFWENKANQQIPLMRTQVRPGSQVVAPR